MKILVTGGQGFLGCHLVKHLKDQGHEPVIFDRSFRYVHTEDSPEGAVGFFQGDIRDREAVDEAINLTDRWVNLAGLLGTSELVNDPFPAIDTNIKGALNCFEAARKYGKPGLQIAVGNHWMENPYSISKTTAERFARMYNHEHDTSIRIVRAMNVFGPGQKHRPVRKMFPNFAIPALLNKPITIYGDGTQIMDVIYVNDVVNILSRLLLEDTVNCFWTYEIGAGPVTVNKIVSIILDVSGSHSKVNYVPMRRGEKEKSVVQISGKGWDLLYQYLGILPQHLTPLRYAFTKTVQWYREHLDEFTWDDE